VIANQVQPRKRYEPEKNMPTFFGPVQVRIAKEWVVELAPLLFAISGDGPPIAGWSTARRIPAKLPAVDESCKRVVLVAAVILVARHNNNPEEPDRGCRCERKPSFSESDSTIIAVGGAR
jgi:hypothetical protein